MSQRATLRGASAQALDDLLTQAGRTRTLGDAATLGEQLFAVASLLRSDVALRRALTDNSAEDDAKTGLADAVFGRALSEPAVKLVSAAAGHRWISGSDLPAALEHVAVITTVTSAGAKGRRVSDELFAVRRMLHLNPDLRDALADPSRTTADHAALLEGILEDKVLPATVTLVAQAVRHARGTVDSTLDDYLDLAAEALSERVATVTTARALSDDEQQRLAAALTRQYDTTVQLHVVVDADLIGGLRVEIGDDVIDGSVSARLDDARRRLAG